ncbi:unnamed protein product [Notodromas monacha]|uniref:Cytoskeleton-associated protein 5 n=1 Tax=Notodromas monacha TaxID=399045 RepID=A0A7R9GES7_9CRUS|nr:unnamed protein product [Notodromas monacha]CAG0920050.1 unnamed protein product [Notodromas monacha]
MYINRSNAIFFVECLEEMSLMIGDHSLRVCGATPAVALKEIAKQIADRDNSVRNAALNAVVQAYFQAGEKIYRMVGALAEKDMSMLEERIKRAQKTRPAVGDATICMDNRGAVPNLASPTSDLNATRSVTHRSGGGGKTRPQSAIFPSHQSPTSPNAHAREEKHMSPPPGVGKKVSRFGELGDFKLGPIEMRRDKLYPDLAEVPDLGMDMSMSMEVQTATKHFLGAGNGGSFAAGTATTLTSKTAAISSGTATVNSLLRDMSSSDAETCRAALCGMLMIVRSRESHRDVLPLCTLTLFREFGNGAIIEGDKRSQTLMDIVMRLLWKIFQAMPNMISRYDCDPILREIDLYYRTFPRNYWADKEKKDRLPIKTVLTLLTTLCKERLSSVLTCLRQHPEYRSTEMGRIIEKFEKERQKKFSAGDANVGMDDGSRTLSRAAHNELTRIFQKIGDKEESNEGLRLLHAFRERHPEADLEPFLVKSSIFFKQYIEDGLGKLDEEKRLTSCEQAGAMSGDDLLSPLDPSLAEGGDVEDPALYFAKIKNLRARLGLKSSPLAENGASSANNDSPTDEQRGVNSGRRSNSSSDKSESAGGLSRESPGDENREILAPMTREEPVQPTVPENIDSIMRRFQLIKRGELK